MPARFMAILLSLASGNMSFWSYKYHLRTQSLELVQLFGACLSPSGVFSLAMSFSLTSRVSPESNEPDS